LHAADPWIIKKLTKADRGLIEANPEEAKMKPGRNAMTHIHGGRCVIEFVLYMDCVLYRYYQVLFECDDSRSWREVCECACEGTDTNVGTSIHM